MKISLYKKSRIPAVAQDGWCQPSKVVKTHVWTGNMFKDAESFPGIEGHYPPGACGMVTMLRHDTYVPKHFPHDDFELECSGPMTFMIRGITEHNTLSGKRHEPILVDR